MKFKKLRKLIKGYQKIKLHHPNGDGTMTCSTPKPVSEINHIWDEFRVKDILATDTGEYQVRLKKLTHEEWMKIYGDKLSYGLIRDLIHDTDKVDLRWFSPADHIDHTKTFTAINVPHSFDSCTVKTITHMTSGIVIRFGNMDFDIERGKLS